MKEEPSIRNKWIIVMLRSHAGANEDKRFLKGHKCSTSGPVSNISIAATQKPTTGLKKKKTH